MVDRACLPGELVLDAIVVDGAKQLDRLGQPAYPGAPVPLPIDSTLAGKVVERGRYIALRWVLNPALGIPDGPFTVWRRPVKDREQATTIAGWHQQGLFTFGWDGITEMQRIELDISAATHAYGLTRADLDDRPVATAVGSGPGTIVLQGGPMIGVRLENPAAVNAVRGLSTVTMANGNGWVAIETVGLPLEPTPATPTYYADVPQGPLTDLTTPVNAAINRLTRWGPLLGWAPLAGLPPWRAPIPAQLIEELRDDLLGHLITVMHQDPPPGLSNQHQSEVTVSLPELRQHVGSAVHQFGGTGDNQRSEMRIRPLQVLATAVASDVWASLALGFGTGAPAKSTGAQDDYMITAGWSGWMQSAAPAQIPWPYGDPPEQIFNVELVKREIAAVALSPRPRSAPEAPAEVSPSVAFVEGAPALDAPFHCATAIRTSRPRVLGHGPRVSGYGLARFGPGGAAGYTMRERRLAHGWVPVGSAEPVRQPEAPPDPELLPETVMLRDSGVPVPISGAAEQHLYALAATDLFGQWSPWSAGQLSVEPAAVQSARVAVLTARARPGSGNSDPCWLTVTAELVWDRQDRSCSRMRVVVHVFNPAPPPAPLPDPPDSPPMLGRFADTTIEFDAAGNPRQSRVGMVQVVGLHPDDTPVTDANPATGSQRRCRITFPGLQVHYGNAREKAVAVYVQAEETIRPTEWSKGWSHTAEVAIAPNPLAPPTPVPPPAQFPDWASLPDPAGFSFAPVSWVPTGAWRYRVYEATEAALLAACEQPGPDLTAPFGPRLAALHALYKIPANWPKLRAAYRKLGQEPIAPPVHEGKMRFDAPLPRGSGLIHCFVVVAVTEANLISSWPEPNQDGRGGFLAYVIPRLLRPLAPEVRAQLNVAGVPEVTARVGAMPAATSIRLYRAANAFLARQVGSMQLIATAPATSGDEPTVIPDPAALRGWHRLQYRAVAVTGDDQNRARMAMDSPPSRSYALLYPPAGPPSVTLTVSAAASTADAAVVRVDTDAPRATTDVGDHSLSCVATSGSETTRFFSTLAGLPVLDTLADLKLSPMPAAYVGSALYLRLVRAPNEVLGLTVDLTDPLDRGTHRLLTVPAWQPDPNPVLTKLAVRRGDGVVSLRVGTNVPLPPNPKRDWTFSLALRPAAQPKGRVTTITHAFSTIPALRDAENLPDPVTVPRDSAIGRVGNQVVLWVRAQVPMWVGVILSNSESQSTSVEKVTS